MAQREKHCPDDRSRPIIAKDLTAVEWRLSYKTSAIGPGGKPVNILHEFYIPALQRSVRYDRVAGFFSSSSLAAASQGFSAFAAGGGKMRLIVGADLAENDVAAILEGNRKLLAERLQQALGEEAEWPLDVERGVTLLSWMVARGVLEVRVAFRVDGRTGQPMAFSDAADGYVHEKWAIFYDAAGNRIYVSGSLNESKNALVQNAENIDVHTDWGGASDRRRVEDAEAEFEKFWNNKNPHLRVMTIPEAVRKRLIRMGRAARRPVEIDGTTAMTARPGAPPPIELLKFALIKEGPRLPYGRYVGLETAPIAPWPHQEVVARRLIDSWPYSYLLCDEVGLGKTIEAGLAIRSLYLSGRVKRVLIAAPASLTEQWQREMAAKFFLPFRRALPGSSVQHAVLFPSETREPGKNLFAPDLCIVSTGLISRKDREAQIKVADDFDVVLLDEAHWARRSNPKNGERSHGRFGNLYKTLVGSVRKKAASLWLATATPMQLDWIEAFDLLALTQRVGAFQRDPSLMWAYYEALLQLVRGDDLDQGQWEFLRQAIKALQRQDPFYWQHLDRAVIDARIRAPVRRWMQTGNPPRGIERKNMARLFFSAAPLSRVMMRHGRRLIEIYRENGQLDAKLAKRHILPVPRLVLDGVERRAYDDLEDYCRELKDKIGDLSRSRKQQNNLGFYLSFLRLRLASSVYALRETLRRRRQKVVKTLETAAADQALNDELIDFDKWYEEDFEEEDERYTSGLLRNRTPQDLSWERQRLDKMLNGIENLSALPLKMREMLRVLNDRRAAGNRIKQTVIFTRFYDTLQDIVTRLRQKDPGMLLGTYSGKGAEYVDPLSFNIKKTDREDIKRRFLRGEIDVLVCTDAAAEGLNLQTADMLINYDLPWNPMKVEQRIGRIDRIGQRHDQIFILNLCYADSAEQIVYDRLLRRLAQAGLIVGVQQVSMLPIYRDEFEQLAAGDLDENKLFQRAKERIQIQKSYSDCMEIPAKELFDIYRRIKDDFEVAASPVGLNDIWDALSTSRYLKEQGCTVDSDTRKKTIHMNGTVCIPENISFTVSREAYELGDVKAGRSLHFATYGDPQFENLLNELQDYDLPPCIAKLELTLPATNSQRAAFAVACISDTGEREIRMITSYHDTANLVIDEAAEIGEKELSGVREQLCRFAEDEQKAINREQAKMIEKENIDAGDAQDYLNLIVAQKLLAHLPPPFAMDSAFWSVVRYFDDKYAQRENMLVVGLPVDKLRSVASLTLFEEQIERQLPRVQDECELTLPMILIRAALNRACRTADKMKESKSSLTIEKILGAINKELSGPAEFMNRVR